ncbi:hypothetical protein [Lacticaseibacillus casei]|uniref:hypothetical protein n=1 Tax=Lacticaseibacillus casei TaxID=1582 RepID=UPI00148647AC|nr:hypothetical protein [Lacticaseibacillus casei]
MLRGGVIRSLPTRAGNTKKIDHEYERFGYCAITSMIEPLTGKQYVDVRRKRTAKTLPR